MSQEKVAMTRKRRQVEAKRQAQREPLGRGLLRGQAADLQSMGRVVYPNPHLLVGNGALTRED